MKRTMDGPMSAQQLLEETLYMPLYFPWKTVRLQRDSLLDQRQRSASANISSAELYHENSKLYPQLLPELRASRLDVDAFRREVVLRRGAASVSETPDPASLLPPHKLLTALAEATDPALFYAIQVRVVAENTVAIHEPMPDTLQIVKRLSAQDARVLRDAVHLMDTADDREGILIILVASFARNEILLGRRGYRRTLLEAGQVAEQILAHARALSMAARAVYEFADRDVDAVMEVDGVEEGTLAVIKVEGHFHVG
ncbi:MAG: hypothetical protein H3C34_26310 [Caldilineaceae bacterium]|nr:hypothetical protein [Caldilineaceae bacterium]